MRRAAIYVAIDRRDQAAALAVAAAVAPHVQGLKVGLEYFVANGPVGVARLGELGLPVFLDLKLHDIPNTVAAAVHAATGVGVRYLTLHAGGGRAMLQAAADAAAACPTPLRLLAVTVLTSLDDDDLRALGIADGTARQVARLAALALDAGIDGLVCSPHEVASLRERFGTRVHLVVPGIRPDGASATDQKRTLTPAEAQAAGADLLVIGRPITAAVDPAAAAQAVARDLDRRAA